MRAPGAAHGGRPEGTPARVAAWTAAALGAASAALSAWWTAGSTALLDTVGGTMEELARERSAPAVLLGVVVVLAKLVGAALGPAVLGWPRRPVRLLALLAGRPRRPVRLLALLAGALLTLWGGANVLLGGAVLTGALDLGPIADERALRWHVLVWDAWFLAWGLALLAALLLVRRGAQDRAAVEPRSTSTGSTSSARPR